MRVNRRNIIIILMLGIAIGRLGLIINPLVDPDRGITVDSEQYLSLAQSILENQRYESSISPQIDLFRAPGYSFFLAVILWLTGGSLMAVLIVQFTLGLLCAYLLYLLGKETVNEHIGLLTSVIFLISPNSLFWSATIMTEILFTTGLLLAIFMTYKALKHKFPIWPIGLLLGILTLIRPIGLYMIIIWGIWFLGGYLLKITGFPPLRKSAQFLLISLIIITPWFVRNYLKHGEFTLSTVSGTTIRSFHLALSLVEAEGITWEEAKLQVLEMEADGSALLSVLQSYPGGFIKAQARGIARTVLGTEVGTWMKLASTQPYESSGILNALLSGDLTAFKDAISALSGSNSIGALLLLGWGILYTLSIALLSLIGVFRIFRHGRIELRSMGVLILVVVLYLIITPGAAGEARFRVPVEPLVAFLCGIVFMPKPEEEPIEEN